MLAFFNMVASAFGLFFGFFNKFSGFSNTFSLLSNFRLLSRKILFAILLVMVVALFALMLAFFYFTVDSLVSVYNLISSFLARPQAISSSGGDIVNVFFLFFNASGLSTGLSAAFPLIASALTFRLMKFLYLSFIKLLAETTKILMHYSSAITAS